MPSRLSSIVRASISAWVWSLKCSLNQSQPQRGLLILTRCPLFSISIIGYPCRRFIFWSARLSSSRRWMVMSWFFSRLLTLSRSLMSLATLRASSDIRLSVALRYAIEPYPLSLVFWSRYACALVAENIKHIIWFRFFTLLH